MRVELGIISLDVNKTIVIGIPVALSEVSWKDKAAFIHLIDSYTSKNEILLRGGGAKFSFQHRLGRAASTASRCSLAARHCL